MLENTVCIVCGAGRGIGKATAKNMAKHDASVVVNDLGVDLSGENARKQPAQETVDDILNSGGEAIAHYGDITDLDYTQQLIEDTVDEFGAVHNISNAAGIIRDNMLFNMSEEDWDAVINVHLKGHFSLLRNVSQHWKRRYTAEHYEKQRSFLCFSSIAAQGNPGQPNYSAAKAGILGLMRNSARELNKYNIRVNAIWPGAVTRMTEELLEQSDLDVSEDNFGPGLVAPLPTFLATEEASGITGNTFGLQGGSLSYISNPETERVMIKDDVIEGGWSAKEISHSLSQLTEGFNTNKTSPPSM